MTQHNDLDTDGYSETQEAEALLGKAPDKGEEVRLEDLPKSVQRNIKEAVNLLAVKLRDSSNQGLSMSERKALSDALNWSQVESGSYHNSLEAIRQVLHASISQLLAPTEIQVN